MIRIDIGTEGAGDAFDLSQSGIMGQMLTDAGNHCRRLAVPWILALSLLGQGACSFTDEVQHTAYEQPVMPGARVVLMDVDIECSLVTASGLVEPNAAWTARCRDSVSAALDDFMSERRAELVVHDPAAIPAGRTARYRELARLYEAVGTSILNRDDYPTAEDKTDWSMGTGVRIIRDDHDADYALFIYLRDQYESGSRVATRLAFAMLGVITTPATQQGFASLVDLETGDVVWFNRLVSTVGDLRNKDSARDAVDELLDGSPVL